ncbi:MAG TPA: Mpo1-like protein [Casimicrobiaceae bacterium]|nr:Mpo1-like protein [Casimicrobiaceae bacterium]
MTRTITLLFERYEEFHRQRANKAIHWICVPLIVWSVLGVLWWLSPLAAYVAIAASVAFYLWLSVPLALGMLAVLAAMLYPLPLLGSQVLIVSAAVFVAAWIGQFIGHAIEGRRPAFVEDVRFFLVGPAWLLGFVYRRLGIAY